MSSEVYKTNLANFLESFSTDGPKAPSAVEERRERAKEARKLQLVEYQQWQAQLELEERREGRTRRNGTAGKKEQLRQCGADGRRKVCFQPRDRLRDAVVRADRGESESLLAS